MPSTTHTYIADLFPNRVVDAPRPHSREDMVLSNIVRLSGTTIIVWHDPAALNRQAGDVDEA